MSRFKPFAISYLNDWCRYDSGFVDGLDPSRPWHDRLRSMSNAVNYYRIARTFPAIDEPERLGGALAAVDAVTGPVTVESVVATVSGLAKAFQGSYGRYAISAASKLLWIRFRSPVIIYDSQAIACLNSTARTRLSAGYYEPYFEEWLRQFAAFEEPIRSACSELPRVKDFSLAYAESDQDLLALVSARWFQERVFDKYLWSGGRS